MQFQLEPVRHVWLLPQVLSSDSSVIRLVTEVLWQSRPDDAYLVPLVC